MDKSIASKIEQALENYFPGLKVRFVILDNGSWYYKRIEGSKEFFYDQYPTLNIPEADAQILLDIQNIIRMFLPNANPIGYLRYGKFYASEEVST